GAPPPLLVASRAAEAAAGRAGQHPAGPETLGGALGQQLRVIRVRRGRSVAVDPDAVRREVHRGGPDEVVHAALVERVRADARGPRPAVGGGYADNRALDAALGHRAPDVLGVEEGAHGGDDHGPLERLRRLVEYAAPAEQGR